MASPYVITYRETHLFSASPAQVWDAMAHSERFEGWWGWLGEFRLEGDALAPGSVLRGLVSPPVPYRMRVRVVIDEAVRPELIAATVDGDLEGDARLRLSARDNGTAVDAQWSVEMMQRPMRIAARLAHPLLRWGHDRVVEATLASFRRYLEQDR